MFFVSDEVYGSAFYKLQLRSSFAENAQNESGGHEDHSRSSLCSISQRVSQKVSCGKGDADRQPEQGGESTGRSNGNIYTAKGGIGNCLQHVGTADTGAQPVLQEGQQEKCQNTGRDHVLF